jgi:hypothetical protein
MEHLSVNYGVEIALLNIASHSFLSCLKNGTSVRGDGIHPFLRCKSNNNTQNIPEEFYIYHTDKTERRDPIISTLHILIKSK